MNAAFVYRNPVTGARLVINTQEGADRIERTLPEMWVRKTKRSPRGVPA